MSSNLLDDINEIINGSWEKSVKSNKIMERLRGETIFIPKKYREKKKSESFCTIDPKECLPLYLSQLEEGTDDELVFRMIKQGVIAIKGNSFGPFNPKAYFEIDNYKILWLLKESFIEGPNFEAGDRGAHNQAVYYSTWQDIVDDDENYKKPNEGTKIKLIRYTHKLLSTLARMEAAEIDKIKDVRLREQIKRLDDEKLNFDENKASEEEIAKVIEEEIAKVMNKVMKHICVLEVNHFPGLALNGNKKSNDDLVSDWGVVNVNLIKSLFNFYSPDIIVCGGVLQRFHKNFHNVESYYDHLIASITESELVKKGKIISKNWKGKILSEFGYTPSKDFVKKYIKDDGSNYIIPTLEGPIFIQSDHPGYSCFTPDNAIADAGVINEWIFEKSKENGSIKSPIV